MKQTRAGRWGGPKFSRADSAAILIITAVIVYVFFDIIFLGKTFSTAYFVPGVNGFASLPNGENPRARLGVELISGGRADGQASAWQFEPWAEVTHKQITSGRIPLWNPHQGIGSPLAANMQSSALDPVMLPLHLNPTPLAWDVFLFLSFLTGSLLMYWFARIMGLHPLSAVVGAVVFVTSGFFFLYSNNPAIRAYFYLPLILGLVESTIRGTSKWPVVALGVVLAAEIYAGMPEASLFVLSFSGTYALFRLFQIRSLGSFWIRFRRLAYAMLLSLGLAAPLLAIFGEYLAHSLAASHGPSTGLLSDPPRYLIGWIMPIFNTDFHLPIGSRNWVGASAAILALAAIASRRAMRSYSGWFFLTWAVLLMAKNHGAPVIEVIGMVPLANLAVFPVWSSPLISFSIAIITAAAVQSLGGVDHPKPAIFLGLLVALAISVLILIRVNSGPIAQSDPHIVTNHFVVAGIAAALTVVGILWKRPLARVLLVAVIVGELGFLAPHGIYAERSDPFRPLEWVDRLVSAVGNSPDRIFGLDGKLYPVTAQAFGLSDLRVMDGLYPSRYVRYIKAFVEPEFSDRWTAVPLDQNSPPKIWKNPMFDLLGVRLIVSNKSDPGDAFMNGIFEELDPTPEVRPAFFNIDGDIRSVVFIHGLSEVRYPIPRPSGSINVSFAYAMDPEVWKNPRAEGVRFVLQAESAREKSVVWEAEYVPRVNPVEPEWRTARVTIPRAVRPEALIVKVEPRASGQSDWAGVANVSIEISGATLESGDYPLVFKSDDISVFENLRRAPRAFIVHKIHKVENVKGALDFFEKRGKRFTDGAIDVSGFRPTEEAVVEASKSELHKLEALSEPKSPSQARIVAYYPDEVVIETKAESPGVLVLTDLYYPGWKAEVNGRESPIFPVNIAFRGVFVESGDSEVKLLYRPPSFGLGLATFGISIAALLTVGAVTVFRWIGDRRFK